MAGFGFFYYAPLCSKWMVLAERLFPGTSPASMIKKVVVDQLIISSILMCCFLMINEGKAKIEFQRLIVSFSVGWKRR